MGGKKVLCTRGKVPQRKSWFKDLHSTVMAPTTFEGEPVICLVIVKGKEPKTDVETGIDIFVDEVGSIEDEDYFEKNFGEGKRFPGGPTCTYKGQKVPCMVRWNKGGGMTTTIEVV